MKKRSKTIAFLVLLLVVAVGIIWGGYDHIRQKLAPAPERPTYKVVSGTVEQLVTAQGKLEPKESVAVGAQVSGQIKVLHVDFGDMIESGQIVAEIDPEIYETQVRASEARLKTLQAQKAQQQAQVLQAKQKWERNKILFADKAVSQEIYQDAETALKVAEAQLVALDAQTEESQSSLEGDKANLNYTKIYAPMSGTVVNVVTKAGETLNANQTTPTIIEIADLNTMTVRAQVAEADVTKIKTGMDIYFTTLGSQDRRWQGTVRQILPSPEEINDVVLYNVLVDVDNKDGQLMTGMTTQMFFVNGRAENVPVIPSTVLTKRAPGPVPENGQAYVVDVVTGKSVESRTIVVGLNDRTIAQIISGLNIGDEIALPGAPPQGTQGNRQNSMRMPRL